MKRSLRDQLRNDLKRIPPHQRLARSLDACKNIISQPQYLHADTIMAYLPMPTEVDTTYLILRAWEEGKQVVVPKVVWKQHRIIPVEIDTLDSEQIALNRNVPEPAEGMPIPPSEIDLVVVPGLGFDRNGFRLGRGGGFYDRFLSDADLHARLCGLAFQEQIVDEIPREEHDMKVGLVCTDKRVYRIPRHLCHSAVG